MKKIIVGALIALVSLFAIVKGLEWWIESSFQSMINSNPERAYNITYSDFDLDSFFKGVTLDNIRIAPLNPENGTVVTGRVEYATMNGLVWTDLLFGNALEINEIAFKQPLFEVTLSTDTTANEANTSGKGLQEMFGDILSRAGLNSFRIQNGSIVFIDPITKDIKGQVKRVNIMATDMETDSLKLKYIIPFKMGHLEINLDSISFELNDYTHFRMGQFHFNLLEKEILMNDISLDYSIDWVEVSKRMGVQKAVIELNIKEIIIHQLDFSSKLYSQLDTDAQKVSIDGLNIKFQKNKNFARPLDEVKPSFQELVNAIPFSILLDSIQISNSSVTYAELGVEKSETGSIDFQEVNGIITGITNVPEEQFTLGQIDAKINASLLGKTSVHVDLRIPYEKENFSLTTDVGEMDLTDMNPTLKALAGLEIVSGQMFKIRYQMDAGPTRSQNKLSFDYSDLHVNLINEKGKHKSKKNVLLSAIANAAIRPNNLPDQNKYLVAEYQSKRNIYRAPMNYIVQGIIQGVTRIVPEKHLQKMIIKDKKNKK